eukprot:m51a1_g7524 hypothetical protein (361) ;mRNA; f:27914-29760
MEAESSAPAAAAGVPHFSITLAGVDHLDTPRSRVLQSLSDTAVRMMDLSFSAACAATVKGQSVAASCIDVDSAYDSLLELCEMAKTETGQGTDLPQQTIDFTELAKAAESMLAALEAMASLLHESEVHEIAVIGARVQAALDAADAVVDDDERCWDAISDLEAALQQRSSRCGAASVKQSIAESLQSIRVTADALYDAMQLVDDEEGTLDKAIDKLCDVLEGVMDCVGKAEEISVNADTDDSIDELNAAFFDRRREELKERAQKERLRRKKHVAQPAQDQYLREQGWDLHVVALPTQRPRHPPCAAVLNTANPAVSFEILHEKARSAYRPKLPPLRAPRTLSAKERDRVFHETYAPAHTP